MIGSSAPMITSEECVQCRFWPKSDMPKDPHDCLMGGEPGFYAVTARVDGDSARLVPIPMLDIDGVPHLGTHLTPTDVRCPVGHIVYDYSPSRGDNEL